ncbi:hypothetical protein EPA93_01415 [Ktedonosporobacter rubrisoli]|uniref:FAD-binding domain-containing protein n=1 Tax=Ktedonosporobacter rubrisoli TaxID=2509675 RepID=A0A4P6JI43_KTERU|nr:FAD-dependent monooxygenase [Ktedonosporobacter rubrisoli]QBD74718.1 hypothetical protein EPA93_01415 [Ktedonosporobacter rubrisoli]
MRVLISGGGIAGLTLAYWLNRYGISSVVIEQAAEIRRDGYGLAFSGAGYEVARRMGLIERLASQQLPFEAIAYVTKTGKRIAKLDSTLMQEIMGGKYMPLLRSTLEETLYSILPDQVEVRFGCTLTQVTQGPESVTVTFNDGTTESFDLLIGADGVHSKTRSLVFGPEEQFARYLGYNIACFPLTDRYGIDLNWKMHLEPGRLASAYCTQRAGEIVTFFMYQADKHEHIPRAQRLAHLQERFASVGWVTQLMLKDATEPERIFMDTVFQIEMPAWHAGRVALIGDACGSLTFISMQGAALAMGGAYLLARALHECADHQEAFQRYEAQMRPHVLTQQKNARLISKFFLPGNSFAMFMQNTMMRILFRRAFRKLLHLQFGAEYVELPAESGPVPSTMQEEAASQRGGKCRVKS